jgi:hypothetical protein
LRFTVASRPQRRYSNVQTVSNMGASTSLVPIQLPATGWVRKIALYFSASVTSGSAGAVVAGDGPWNIAAGITLTDATGQPVFQPISGYNLYLKNKYSTAGSLDSNTPRPWDDPHLGPEYAFASTATVGTAAFRLDIDLEQDANTGYGCIPNLDSNASLQVKVDIAPHTVAFAGTGTTISTVSCRISQYYWAPIGSNVGGVPAQSQPVGFGDYLETRFENPPVNAAQESVVNLTNRGGLIKNVITVSRNAGARTAYAPGSNVGVVLDNNPIDEGIPLEEYQDWLRRVYGYIGADITTSYAPLSPGILPGLDRGVLVWPWFALSGGRDSWLNTRVGSLFQIKVTPGAGASTLEVVTELMQVKDAAAFYNPSALN